MRNKQGSIKVEGTEVMVVSNSRTYFDKDEIIKVVGMEECIRHGLLTLNNKAAEEWLYSNPVNVRLYQEAIKEKYGLKSEREFSKAWLSTKKSKGVK